MADEAKPHRVTLSDVVGQQAALLDTLAGRGKSASSATLKLSAQGVLQPELTVHEGADPEAVAAMVELACEQYAVLLAAAQPPQPKGGAGGKGDTEKAARRAAAIARSGK